MVIHHQSVNKKSTETHAQNSRKVGDRYNIIVIDKVGNTISKHRLCGAQIEETEMIQIKGKILHDLIF